MDIFPVTYIVILLWLLMSYTAPSLSLKAFGSIFGLFVGLFTMAGESWLIFNTTTLLFTLQQFDDGFQVYLGLFTFILSLYNLVGIIVYFITEKKDGNSTFKILFNVN